MIMEIKMNNSLTFDEVADKLGCSVEDLQKIALENGLIDEVGRLFTSVNVAIRHITRKDYENNR